MGEQVQAISHLHGNLRNLLRLAALMRHGSSILLKFVAWEKPVSNSPLQPSNPWLRNRLVSLMQNDPSAYLALSNKYSAQSQTG